jgi:hypothetical protein
LIAQVEAEGSAAAAAASAGVQAQLQQLGLLTADSGLLSPASSGLPGEEEVQVRRGV